MNKITGYFCTKSHNSRTPESEIFCRPVPLRDQPNKEFPCQFRWMSNCNHAARGGRNVDLDPSFFEDWARGKTTLTQIM